MTKLNFTGCSTGRSAGVAPRRILPTRAPLRRTISGGLSELPMTPPSGIRSDGPGLLTARVPAAARTGVALPLPPDHIGSAHRVDRDLEVVPVGELIPIRALIGGSGCHVRQPQRVAPGVPAMGGEKLSPAS